MRSIYRTDQKATVLKIKLTSKSKNDFAIGAKIYAYANGIKQFKELYTVRGFQASSEPLIHFGLGQEKTVDSIRIIWPDKTSQKLTNIEANQTLAIKQENTQPFNYVNIKRNNVLPESV